MAVSHDEKEFLALLQQYSSEDCRRARRNVSVISFLIVAAHILGVRLTDIRALGADITRADEGIASMICLAVIVYWSSMFAVTWLHDREIEKERRIQGEKAASALKARYEHLAKQNETPNRGHVHPEWRAVRDAYKAYQRQIERTQTAARYKRAIHFAEFWVPASLAAVAVFLLAQDIYKALRP